MSHSFHDTARTLDVSSASLGWSARIVAGVRDRLALARTRKVVAGLSAAQLADTGIEPLTLEPPRPVIEVEAGLMTKLMEMR